MKDLGAGLRNFFGGRSAGYEEELQKARGEALAELEQRAGAMGANAVIGVDIDYEVFRMIAFCSFWIVRIIFFSCTSPLLPSSAFRISSSIFTSLSNS